MLNIRAVNAPKGKFFKLDNRLAGKMELLDNPNVDGNTLNQTVSELEGLGPMTASNEGLKNNLLNKARNRLLINTQTAGQQELARQTTFAGANMQMQTERKRLLGV